MKKNVETSNLNSNLFYNFQQSKYYSTRFEPPKKVTKEKKLSDGIKKFLAKKEAEEREKEEAKKRQIERLMEMRSEKDKNKIRKMLKVTKSANRSVLEDAVNTTDTAVTLQGPEQPDEDDYGYTSHESSALYKNLMDKYKTIPEDKKFSDSAMRRNKNGDLMSTKDRVREAIIREKEDEHSGRKRQSTSTHGSLSNNHSESEQRHRSRKNLYDPRVEREEEERRKKEEEAQRRKMKPKRPPPPVMDFNKLLELAKEKQHQPIEIEVKPQKPKEPERLLTAKEKREIEARKAHIEGKDKKNVAPNRPQDGADSRRTDQPTNGRIPKLPGALSKPSSSSIDSKKMDISGAKDLIKARTVPFSSHDNIGKLSTVKTYSPHPSKKPSQSHDRRPPIETKPRGQESLQRSLPKQIPAKKTSQGRPVDPKSVRPREFPPKDVTESRDFPPRDVAKPRDFPPKDLQKSREFPPRDVMAMKKKQKQMGQKRRVIDSDSEYDSEMDDFIDDDDADMDFSSHIKEIFGYDKNRYRDDDDDIDRMESNFAQVQREEFISKKIGIMEDLEDMRMEEEEKKRKAKRKRL